MLPPNPTHFTAVNASFFNWGLRGAHSMESTSSTSRELSSYPFPSSLVPSTWCIDSAESPRQLLRQPRSARPPWHQQYVATVRLLKFQIAQVASCVLQQQRAKRGYALPNALYRGEAASVGDLVFGHRCDARLGGAAKSVAPTVSGGGSVCCVNETSWSRIKLSARCYSVHVANQHSGQS